jgi:hypothetical protein
MNLNFFKEKKKEINFEIKSFEILQQKTNLFQHITGKYEKLSISIQMYLRNFLHLENVKKDEKDEFTKILQFYEVNRIGN